MAVNKPKGDNARKGAVKKRSQLATKTMGKTWTKRDKTTGEFIDQKKRRRRRRSSKAFVARNNLSGVGPCSSARLHSQGIPAPHWQPNSSDHASCGWFSHTHPIPRHIGQSGFVIGFRLRVSLQSRPHQFPSSRMVSWSLIVISGLRARRQRTFPTAVGPLERV
jgi:hypothetical protein